MRARGLCGYTRPTATDNRGAVATADTANRYWSDRVTAAIDRWSLLQRAGRWPRVQSDFGSVAKPPYRGTTWNWRDLEGMSPWFGSHADPGANDRRGLSA